jgi:hypothetical protein
VPAKSAADSVSQGGFPLGHQILKGAKPPSKNGIKPFWGGGPRPAFGLSGFGHPARRVFCGLSCPVHMSGCTCTLQPDMYTEQIQKPLCKHLELMKITMCPNCLTCNTQFLDLAAFSPRLASALKADTHHADIYGQADCKLTNSANHCPKTGLYWAGIPR